MTNPPLAGAQPPASCGTCRFSREVRPDQTVIQKMRVCMLMPPQVIALPTPTGIQLTTNFPAVADQMSCFQFKPIETVPESH